MLYALLAILLCQLAGEVVVRAAGLSLPGPVLGMLLLFGVLLVRKEVPEAVEEAAQRLLSHLSLLFVPAGVGVITHFARIREEWIPLLVALVVSTALTIGVAALVFQWVERRLGGAAPSGGED